MTSFSLDTILTAVSSRAASRRRQHSLRDLRADVIPDVLRKERFLDALKSPRLSIIAEFKRRSPSSGVLADVVDPMPRLASYTEAGAAAVSILTEHDFFAGDLTDLERAADCGLPRLRKDFILDESMILESALFGADAVLLIVACLDGGLLGELRAAADEYGLAVLMEIHGLEELDRAMETQPDCLGVNARNLKTLEVDPEGAALVLDRIPAGPLKVAESGITDLTDLFRAAEAGADVALVGTALMKEENPYSLLAGWIQALEQETNHA